MMRTACRFLCFVIILTAPVAISGTLVVDLEPEWLEIESDENGNTLVRMSISDFTAIAGKRIDSAYLYIELFAIADPEEGQANDYITLAIVCNGDDGESIEDAIIAEYTLRAAQTRTTIFDLTNVYRTWASQVSESYPIYLKCIDPQEGAEIELSPNSGDAAGWLEIRYSNHHLE